MDHKNAASLGIEERRSILETTGNPERGIEYLCSFQVRLFLPPVLKHAQPGDHRATHLTIRYVPDRLILRPEILATYLPTASADCRDSLETLAALILSDMANVLVPRWLDVTLKQEETSWESIALTQTVTLEDRQPGWSNRSLESRLGLY